nr:hypothetical protein [Marinicella sp. W31]MDC2878998.1 hypothetical protein [Marinicella sp. W31]
MSDPNKTTVGPVGIRHLFEDQTYHFQALRVLSDAGAGAADIAEVLQAISTIPAGDADAWYDAFARIARVNEKLAEDCGDRVSRGLARFRAHTYWRTAEFFLASDDPRRAIAWKSQIENFDQGLTDQAIAYQRYETPYENGVLKSIFFPVEGGEKRPLLVIVGGFDGTLEELHFMMGKAANERGYSTLLYEGPGQSGPVRDQQIYFTHEWEKPTSAIIDDLLEKHPEYDRIILTGISLGGYLAPRAAAFDDRIDGVIAFDVMYDLGAVVEKFRPMINHPVYSKLPGVSWALENGQWVFGKDSPEAFIDAAHAFTLAGVAQQIKGDVLILAGEIDHFVPVSQVEDFEKALVNARSVEHVIFSEESGGGEHCQVGAAALWQASAFDWILRRFG